MDRAVAAAFLLAVVIVGAQSGDHGMSAEGDVTREARQWECVEWHVRNPVWEGNPFEVVATVTFVHPESGERRVTEMFYNGGETWRFRFTGTRPGRWSYVSASRDPDLHGRTGEVMVEPADPADCGFVTGRGNRWCRRRGPRGKLEAFVPQFAMYRHPRAYHRKPHLIDRDIQTFMVEHGFTGFHTLVFCRWFDIQRERSTGIEEADPNPDPRTFEALEMLIRKVHAAGGVVHIWAWGDESRHQTPARWGINGRADRRLQRYIAARLGPMPGWTMGYGYDLWEWTSGPELTAWHRYLQEHMGWRHMLGARSWKHSLDQMSEAMDYASYEQHKPDYEDYLRTTSTRPSKPAFSEDRFRIRGRQKDYTMEETRRGLWHSTMAGGVANIWGNLRGEEPEGGGSRPYPRPEWIRTCATFFEQRFGRETVVDNALTDGRCLRRADRSLYVFYRENASSVRMDLSGADGSLRGVAVDTTIPYRELKVEGLRAGELNWTAPRESDWALAISVGPGQ